MFWKESRGQRLGISGVLIFAAAMIVSTIRLYNVERTIRRNADIIVDQAITIQTQRNEIAKNRQRLGGVAPAILSQSANGQSTSSTHDGAAATIEGRSTHGQRIVLFARSRRGDAKQRELVGSLRRFGFNVQVQQRNAIGTANAVWFGTDVSPVAVEIAAHAMLRAGYTLQHIGPFENPDGSKARLIEIGTSSASLDQPAITQQTLQRALRAAGLPPLD